MRRVTKAVGRLNGKIESKRDQITIPTRPHLVSSESLERRLLLSVSDTVMAGPVTVPGNSWTYAMGTGSETLTSKGLVTHDSQQMIEIDVVFSSPGFPDVAGQNYYAFEPQGYVLSELKTTSATGRVNDEIDSPPELLLPPTLTAGVPVTSAPSTETQTTTQSGGDSTTSTETVTTTTTLVSETPSVPISAAGTTYTCFEVDQTKTMTDTSSVVTTDMSQSLVDPTIGLVQITDVTSGTVVKLSNFAGTSYHLAVSPVTNPLVDENINPAVQVTIVDSSNATDTNAADAVTVTASIDPVRSSGTGTLVGTSTATTVDGVATFSTLSINKPGHYILNFTDSVSRSVSTGSFQVIAGTLIFKRSILNGVAGTAIRPEIEVELVDSRHRVITDFPSLVSLNITGANSNKPITGNTAEMVRGIALFSSVKLGAPGEYTLSATDDNGDAQALSNQFIITGVHLVFQRQPQKAGVDAPLRYIIELKDFRNRRVNTSSVGLGFTLDTSQGSAGAMLNSTSDTVDFGIANNGDRSAPASITMPGTYKITATVISQNRDEFDYTIDPIISDAFDVVANHLQIVRQPHTTFAGVALRYEVVIKDFLRHIVTANHDQLQFTLLSPAGTPDTTGAVLSGGVDFFLAGIAINGANTLSIDTPGTYKLKVADVPAIPGDPIADPVTSALLRIRQPR